MDAPATAGIDETIERVETLYRAVTGREPPPPGPIAAGPVAAQVFERVDRLLGRLSGLLEPGWTPPVAVIGAGTEVVVRADVGGVARQDLRAELMGGVLVVEGERRGAPAGPFVQAIRLPEGARPDGVTARLAGGVLEVRVPCEPNRSTPIDVA
jgi:HSP20 family molecular chaperone IbpA